MWAGWIGTGMGKLWEGGLIDWEGRLLGWDVGCCGWDVVRFLGDLRRRCGDLDARQVYALSPFRLYYLCT